VRFLRGIVLAGMLLTTGCAVNPYTGVAYAPAAVYTAPAYYHQPAPVYVPYRNYYRPPVYAAPRPFYGRPHYAPPYRSHSSGHRQYHRR
jgi:hypothetical protein